MSCGVARMSVCLGEGDRCDIRERVGRMRAERRSLRAGRGRAGAWRREICREDPPRCTGGRRLLPNVPPSASSRPENAFRRRGARRPSPTTAEVALVRSPALLRTAGRCDCRQGRVCTGRRNAGRQRPEGLSASRCTPRCHPPVARRASPADAFHPLTAPVANRQARGIAVNTKLKTKATVRSTRGPSYRARPNSTTGAIQSLRNP